MKIKRIVKYASLAAVLCVCIASAQWVYVRVYAKDAQTDSIMDIDKLLGEDENAPPPVAVPATLQEAASQPKDTTALGGYDVLIADSGE